MAKKTKKDNEKIVDLKAKVNETELKEDSAEILPPQEEVDAILKEEMQQGVSIKTEVINEFELKKLKKDSLTSKIQLAINVETGACSLNKNCPQAFGSMQGYMPCNDSCLSCIIDFEKRIVKTCRGQFPFDHIEMKKMTPVYKKKETKK